jgi:hypothetical protein
MLHGMHGTRLTAAHRSVSTTPSFLLLKSHKNSMHIAESSISSFQNMRYNTKFEIPSYSQSARNEAQYWYTSKGVRTIRLDTPQVSHTHYILLHFKFHFQKYIVHVSSHFFIKFNILSISLPKPRGPSLLIPVRGYQASLHPHIRRANRTNQTSARRGSWPEHGTFAMIEVIWSNSLSVL